MKCDEGELDGIQGKVYDYIVQHFIGSLSPNCKYKNLTTVFRIGKELFRYEGARKKMRGKFGRKIHEEKTWAKHN